MVMQQLGAVGILKQYFTTDARPVTMDELKALDPDERKELADLAAPELGFTFNIDSNKYEKAI